ncbi:GntR family transcriptional regulator [Labrys wisconsinensis]|uniref:DNA-binding GntR family transcriptional regulator n=1 Tax=Labrys wisconsinensis TaxID=425677 RepID=A0ABU0JLD0_9HYPH|nr:GntR family transcriptional regulator [Labrys wisconsinensis]MDQ0474420.1 DNA-binding GntR family transcriptional regulator [Labrys wisconsinensis]
MPKPLALPVSLVPKATLQDQVYRRLSDLILNGEIAPGQTVTIQAVSDAFGVSAMPVREALQRLTAARALTVISGRSIGIPRLTRERLLDLQHVRMAVEGLAGEWAAGQTAPAELAYLEGEFATLSATAATGDVKGYLRANRNFHFAIYRAAGSEVLLGVIESLWLQISPYFHLLHASGNYAVSNREHAEMLQAMRMANPPAMRTAIVADIEAAAAELLTRLDEASA